MNFWPVSSNCPGCSSYWDSTTDGDKMMQNAVIWASKSFPEQIEEEYVKLQKRIDEERDKFMIKKLEKESGKIWEMIKQIIE